MCSEGCPHFLQVLTMGVVTIAPPSQTASALLVTWDTSGDKARLAKVNVKRISLIAQSTLVSEEK
jgi:hypothetical protein